MISPYSRCAYRIPSDEGSTIYVIALKFAHYFKRGAPEQFSIQKLLEYRAYICMHAAVVKRERWAV
jgi:hypothetical protein